MMQSHSNELQFCRILHFQMKIATIKHKWVDTSESYFVKQIMVSFINVPSKLLIVDSVMENTISKEQFQSMTHKLANLSNWPSGSNNKTGSNVFIDGSNFVEHYCICKYYRYYLPLYLPLSKTRYKQTKSLWQREMRRGGEKKKSIFKSNTLRINLCTFYGVLC